jgi:hypothetical protein
MTQPTPSTHHTHSHDPAHSHSDEAQRGPRVTPPRSVLAWPAWLRALAVLPVVLALWLAVWWANDGVSPW